LVRRHSEAERVLAEAERTFDRARKRFESAQSHDAGVDFAVRSRNAAVVYQDALVRQKLEELESRILDSFNALCRKQHLLSRVHIDATTFRTELRGHRGQRVALEDFSAGERQL